MATSRVTTPAPKYLPTPIYGTCEGAQCRSRARTTCSECGGHFCLHHGEHVEHAGAPAGRRGE